MQNFPHLYRDTCRTLRNTFVCTCGHYSHTPPQLSRGSSSQGFTVIELLITIGIYIMLMSIVLASYRTFNSNAIFANAGEDIVLALRQAQVYGVGTRVNPVGCGVSLSTFDCAYGVHINMATPNTLISFVDIDADKMYTSGTDTIIQSLVWGKSISITSITCGALACFNNINITFNRPTPDAFITDAGGIPNRADSGTIILTDANTGKNATILLTNAGQISVQ